MRKSLSIGKLTFTAGLEINGGSYPTNQKLHFDFNIYYGERKCTE